MTAQFLPSNASNPLDIAEQLIMDRDLLFDRPIEEELVAEVSGLWCHYRIWFTWQPDLQVLIFSSAFDTKLPEQNLNKLHTLLANINEKLWMGHFDVCSDDHLVTFRHAIPLRGSQGATSEQIEDLMDIAISECDRFYPAFQSVMWGGNSCDEAIQIALMDTVGEA